MSNIERNKIDSHIESLIEMGFTVKEIKETLSKNTDLTDLELSDKVRELNLRFLPGYNRIIKRYFIIALIWIVITLLLIVLYKYFDYKYNHHLNSLIGTDSSTSLGNGKYLIKGGGSKWHEIFASMAGWTGITSLASLGFSGYTWLKKIKIRMQK